MSERSLLPNTENFNVAQIAVAYEIARTSMLAFSNNNLSTPESFAQKFTEIYMTTWKKVIERKEEPKQ